MQKRRNKAIVAIEILRFAQDDRSDTPRGRLHKRTQTISTKSRLLFFSPSQRQREKSSAKHRSREGRSNAECQKTQEPTHWRSWRFTTVGRGRPSALTRLSLRSQSEERPDAPATLSRWKRERGIAEMQKQTHSSGLERSQLTKRSQIAPHFQGLYLYDSSPTRPTGAPIENSARAASRRHEMPPNEAK